MCIRGGDKGCPRSRRGVGIPHDNYGPLQPGQLQRPIETLGCNSCLREPDIFNALCATKSWAPNDYDLILPSGFWAAELNILEFTIFVPILGVVVEKEYPNNIFQTFQTI